MNIAIIGGGTAGWMTAALLSKELRQGYKIRLVESEDIGTIGVGEATVPAIKEFNRLLGIHEVDFIKATRSTFKLGIEFVNWGQKGGRYFHDFHGPAAMPGPVDLHHYWLRLKQQGLELPDLGQYGINTVAARLNRFLPTQTKLSDSPLSELNYAYHFDAGLYARLLRTESLARGVQRTEGKIINTELRANDGFIEAVVLESGERIHADMFIDCSGLKALLIGQALGCEFKDWTNWLLCNRALAVPSEPTGELFPYTRSTALDAGWQWRIPLQHRIGNGHIYASDLISDDDAQESLLKNLDGKALAEARQIRFTPGKRERTWHKNCVAIGLAGGFLEPLESTSILLIQTGLMRLLSLLPDSRFLQPVIDEYNRQTELEYSQMRDFIIAHYKVVDREDTPFWRHCKHMSVPDSLTARLDLFKSSARYFRSGTEFFIQSSWVQVLLGQNISVTGYDPQAELVPISHTLNHMKTIQNVVKKCADIMPRHADYIAQLRESEIS